MFKTKDRLEKLEKNVSTLETRFNIARTELDLLFCDRKQMVNAVNEMYEQYKKE